MEPTQIRPATERDLPDLLRLLTELFTVIEHDTGIDGESLTANCQALIAAHDSLVMVAVSDDEIIGLANVNLRRTLLHTGPSALIDELVVTEACRGKGVGRRLLRAVLDHCRQLGCSEIEVTTEETNERARAFYHQYGFKERGILFEKDFE